MVLKNIYRGFQGKRGKKIRPAYTLGGVGRYIVADSAGQRALKSTTQATVHKQKTYGTAISDVTSVRQEVLFPSTIDAGREVFNRRSNRINIRHIDFKGTVLWDHTGTPDNVIRMLVYLKDKDYSTAGISHIANVYGRNNFPGIRHVYKDIRFTRPADDKEATSFNFRVNTKGLPVRYNGDTGSTDLIQRDIGVLFVSDNAAGTSDVTHVDFTTYWSEH